MLVPHSELVEGPQLVVEGPQLIVEGPQPMEGSFLTPTLLVSD